MERLPTNHIALEDDFSLFLLVSQGDKDAFRRLFEKYSPYVTRIAQKIVGGYGAEDDVVQTVFVKIWEKRELLPTIENSKAWIARITCFHCYNLLKREKISQKASAQIRYVSQTAVNDVEETIYFDEVSNSLSQAIQQLPKQSKLIFILNKEKGWSIGEIAESLQLSPQTVKNTLTTAQKRVKFYLRQQGVTNFIIFLFSISTLLTLGCLGI